MVEFNNNFQYINQYGTVNSTNKPSDAVVKKETPTKKDSKDTFEKQGNGGDVSYSGPSFQGLSDEQAEILAYTFAETLGLHGQIFAKQPGQEDSASPNQLTAMRNYYGNIHNVYNDADGFIYIAGQGMQPYSEDGSKYPTKDNLQKIADKALEQYLTVATTGSVDDLKSAMQAKGRLDEEDKQRLADALKEQAKSMTPQEIRKYQSLLGAAYTNLIPGLDTHDKAKAKIEESERLLSSVFSNDVAANADLQNQIKDEDLILFAASIEDLREEPNGGKALQAYRNIIGGANLDQLSPEQISAKASQLEKKFNMEYA